MGQNVSIINVALAKLAVDNAWNMRAVGWADNAGDDLGKEGFDTLVESIKTFGVQSPIIVRPSKRKGADYDLVCGFRRVEAAKRVGLATVPAIVRDVTDSEARVLNATENAAREGLATHELVQAVMRPDFKGMTQQRIAAMLGKTQGYVSKLLKIATLAKIAPDAFGHWVKGPVRLDVKTMGDLVDAAAGDGVKALRDYQEAAGLVERDTSGDKTEAEKIGDRAYKVGLILGRLVNVKAIPMIAFGAEAGDLAFAALKIRGKRAETLGVPAKRAAASRIVEGYNFAVAGEKKPKKAKDDAVPPPPPVKGDDDDDDDDAADAV